MHVAAFSDSRQRSRGKSGISNGIVLPPHSRLGE
uniref:Uncharacterized protein n=1 Tax=Brassica campestris TaxID=3711 RepID=A0A3P5YSC3_BRACM|nr:unnamed protein product [Brassica rapa]